MSAARRLPDPPALPGFTRTTGELGGGGANGLVFRALCDATQELVAIKYLYRAELAAKADGIAVLERELRNHALSVHPHIAGFRQAVLLPEWVAIVCELCEGQNLLGWLNVQPQRQASEAVARGIVVQILSALHHMHGTGIVHRDIKADNICLARPSAPGEVPVLKIVDFGASKSTQIDSKPNSLVGTYYYMSPELFEVERAQSAGQSLPSYDGFKVDTWAVGITLHILLRGDYPFGGLADGLALTASKQLSNDLLRKLKKSVDVSADCTDFITKCLTYDHAARPSVQELCAHKWFTGCGDVAAGTAVVDPAVLQHVNDIVNRVRQGLA